MGKILISIGRQFGSGGRMVALAVGEKLGVSVYDSELISKAAQESGFSRDLFTKSDERRSIFSSSGFFGSGRYSLTENYVSENELFKIQSEVIRSTAEKGSAIFVGRCSDYILREMDCMDVFITAPLQKRIERVCERSGLDEREAEKLIERRDHTRESYYNYFTFGNWGQASNYDICLDSSVLGTEGTAEMIVEYARRRGML